MLMKNDMKVKIEENKITSDHFIKLRKTGPFVEYRKEDVEEALKKTLYSVVLFYEGEAVAMGRVVGDGKVAFIIKDVVVEPRYRGLQLGKLVMDRLLHYIKSNGASKAYVGLMASVGTEAFYEQFGFVRRPNANHGAGMILFLEEDVRG